MAETAISAAFARAGVGLSGRRARARELLDELDVNLGEEAAMDEEQGVDPVVEHLRQLFAKVVQEMEELRGLSKSSELVRICSIAITNAQTAEMWAVRAATYGRAP